MHIEISFAGILFGLVLTGLFCLKLLEYYGRYVRPFFEKKFNDLRNEQVEFLEKENLLQTTRKRVENQLVQQRLQFIVLERAMQRFHAASAEEIAFGRAQQLSINEQLVQKRALQAKNFNQVLDLRAVLPQALAEAREQLAQECKKHEVSARLRGIINRLT